jgi:hypothetical protein
MVRIVLKFFIDALYLRVKHKYLFKILYKPEAWPFILKEENRPNMFENRMLRKIFRFKRLEEAW